MRPIGLIMMCGLLAACTTPPVFPPELTKDIETDTIAVKAWKDQVTYPSGANFTSHKVELGGQITEVLHKPDGVVILAEEQPIDKYLGYGPTSLRRKDAFEFAIVFHGFPDPDMLQVGNQLAVVGATGGSSPEMIDRTPRVVPHLVAQCLHIWKTEGFDTNNYYEGSMGQHYPLENQTFCQEQGTGKTLSTGGGQDSQATDSTGS